MNAAVEFDVFISYATADAEIVLWFVERLKADGFSVWFDEDNMAAGLPVMDQLGDAIANSAHTVAFLSDKYLSREYTNFELQSSMNRDPASKLARTIPVKLRPLTRDLPNFIQHLKICELTDPATFERTYAQIKQSIRQTAPGIGAPAPESPHAEPPHPAGDDQSRRPSRRAVLAGLAGVGLLAGGVGTIAAWLLTPSDTAPSGPGRPSVVRWKASIDDVVVFSAPAVADGVVYLSSYDKHVYALDAATGAVRWKTPTGDRVRPSPAVAGGLVYVASWDGYVYALDRASGVVDWKTPTGDRGASFPVSPVVAGGTVYLGTTDWYVYALDAGTGTVRWKTLTGGPVWSSPAVAGGLVYLGNGDFSVYALDAGTGTVRWKTPTGGQVYSSPAVAGGLVYVGSYDKNVYALDGASGAVRWEIPTGDRVYSSPTVADTVVYVGSWDGYLYALDAGTGAVRWKTPVGGQVWSSPTVAHTVVYLGSADGKVYAVQG